MLTIDTSVEVTQMTSPFCLDTQLARFVLDDVRGDEMCRARYVFRWRQCRRDAMATGCSTLFLIDMTSINVTWCCRWWRCWLNGTTRRSEALVTFRFLTLRGTSIPSTSRLRKQSFTEDVTCSLYGHLMFEIVVSVGSPENLVFYRTLRLAWQVLALYKFQPSVSLVINHENAFLINLR